MTRLWNALRSWRLFRLTPAVRVSLGLTALAISCLLLIDIVIGVVPDQKALKQTLRERVSENLAIQIAARLEADDRPGLGRLLTQALTREDDVRSVAVRRTDFSILAQAGDHSRHWAAPPDGKSTIDHVRVPLFTDKQHWGDVEISFDPIDPGGLRGLLSHPLAVLVVVLGVGGFVLFSLYLRKVFEYLDPSSVIPERVRLAFDAFSEGVMVVDTRGRVMLANALLRRWAGRNDKTSQTGSMQSLPGMQAALSGNSKDYPWMRAMASRSPLKGEYMEFPQPEGQSIKVMVSCAPIFDGQRGLRGCIVTFDDITELERVNQKLSELVEELVESKAKIERQNEGLRQLAMRDPLTGCLNRRSFFEALDELFASAQGTGNSLCCIVTDIDHFKSFNDRYGHAIGDQVLHAFARTLSSGLRDRDLLCRYGGEEFCMILPDVSMTEGMAVAERLRFEVAERSGKSIRTTPGLSITASFGVCFTIPGIEDPSQLIERADKALYVAKRSGRNRVCLAEHEQVTAEV
jgi:diguanylate cyclase (GGDEF)-like protein/PAS domain S-box-containing protein